MGGGMLCASKSARQRPGASGIAARLVTASPGEGPKSTVQDHQLPGHTHQDTPTQPAQRWGCVAEQLSDQISCDWGHLE